MEHRIAARVAVFARSLLLLGALVVIVPGALLWAAERRFGGRSPLHGVAPPAEWELDRIRSALTDRLTDQTVADIVIRSALVVAWVALLVVVTTVIAEGVHMVRHDGLALPDVRGLGLSQGAARYIAAGLLVVMPALGAASTAIARGGVGLVAEPRAAPAVAAAAEQEVAAERRVAAEPSGTSAEAPSDASDDPTAELRYVVRAGDSIYGIAERMAGPEPGAVKHYADRLLEINLGRRMIDGQHFTNAAFIDVGWVLELPPGRAPVGPTVGGPTARQHLVERGETLWSIADDELGDPLRWPEIYDANRGRSFADGRVLDDPDLIHPGWDLDLPVVPESSAPPATAPVDSDPAPVVRVEPGIDEPGIVEPGIDEPGIDEPDVDEPAAPPSEFAAPEPAAQALQPVAENVWIPKAETIREHDGGTTARSPRQPDDREPPPVGAPDAAAPELLTYRRAAMLSAGVLTLLAMRRRNRLRRARPRARLAIPTPVVVETERSLRATDTGERFRRVDTAIRSAAPALIEADARVLAVVVGPDGDIELIATGPADLPAPWTGSGSSWRLGAATPVELLADGGGGSPCPTLVQLGRDRDGRDVYVDLEALEALEIGGPGDQADAVVAAIAMTLAGSTLAEVTTLVGLGVDDAAFLDHRHHEPVRDVQQAFEVAGDAIGSTARQSRSTFALRGSTATSAEAWEPAVVLVGSAAGTVTPPPNRTGLAVVSASPIHGPSSRLAPDGDAWILRPAGLHLVPVGLTATDVAAIADLVDVAEPVPPERGVDDVVLGGDDDLTIAPTPDDDRAAPSEPDWALLVRLLGPVTVVDRDGAPVAFERSKTRELVAWLATHRERSTRTAARTALWELDVRDATFSNVVSEARRALARLVEPPAGEEWVGRTMTEDLPLHHLVRTDADLLEAALDAATLQAPDQAVATLAPAVARISGLPFEGTSYLWPDAEGLTSQLVLLATSAATELAAHCLSLGDVDGVFAATGRGLRVLPGHEELIGLRMQAHARTGDHAGVRQEWESYERVINGDPWSDGEPSPKLVELRRELLNPSR